MPRAALCALVLVLGVSVGASAALAQAGAVRCIVTANGAPATGTITLVREGERVEGGSCDQQFRVPAGEYAAVVRLDGALDHPSREKSIRVVMGETAVVKVNFKTAVLQVDIKTKSRGGAAMVMVLKGGKKIGTLGSGVAAHITAATYDVVVRYGGQEQRFEKVKLRPGQHRILRAQF